jgi:hypothetical protein
MKLKPILVMLPQMANVLPGDTVVPFADPHYIGNPLLYLLLLFTSRPILSTSCERVYEPFNDKALKLIQ